MISSYGGKGGKRKFNKMEGKKRQTAVIYCLSFQKQDSRKVMRTQAGLVRCCAVIAYKMETKKQKNKNKKPKHFKY